jgi:hypothetical protein
MKFEYKLFLHTNSFEIYSFKINEPTSGPNRLSLILEEEAAPAMMRLHGNRLVAQQPALRVVRLLRGNENHVMLHPGIAELGILGDR